MYVVFDMDQTIADINQVYFFIVSLTMKEYTRSYCPYLLDFFPNEIEASMRRAYELFVIRVAEAESSSNPIGILRPGMIDIIKQIDSHPDINGVAIYSNNPYEPNVHFIRDLIHQIMTKPIIDPCIHWGHPMREIDHQLRSYVTKTWVTLRSIMIKHGAPINLEPEHVIFFDDQSHHSLEITLEDNYYKVPEYYAKNQNERIRSIYISCIEDTQIDLYTHFMYYVEMMRMEHVFAYTPDSVESKDMGDLIVYMIDKHISPVTSIDTVVQDGINIMKEAIERIHRTESPKQWCGIKYCHQ